MGNKIADEYYGQKREAVRLNKYISDSGLCSRREADRLIEAGKVKIDGAPAKQGTKVLPGQTVTVGKKTLKVRDEMVVLAFNKPVGVVCTEDKKTKNNIIRFLNYPVRVTYVGRLDKDSEGLILMTNNGDIINKIMRSGNRHEKEYKVTVNKPVTEEFIRSMEAGVHIVDQEKGMDEITRPCKVLKAGKYKFRIILTQGLNRQIRRMCESLGCQVTSLKRTRIMNIELGTLNPGEYRKLTDEELNIMHEQIKDSSNETITESGVDYESE